MSTEVRESGMRVGSPNRSNEDSVSQLSHDEKQKCVNGSVNGVITGSPETQASRLSSPQKLSNETIESSFVHVSHEDTVVDSTFLELIQKMKANHYNVSVDVELIQMKCKLLFERDYRVEIVKNQDMTPSYSSVMIIPVAEKDATEEEIDRNPMKFDAELYSNLAMDARAARLRSRVAAPVILFENKFICRSATLTVCLSAIYEVFRKSMQLASRFDIQDPYSAVRSVSSGLWSFAEVAFSTVQLLITNTAMTNLFSSDLKLLEHLQVERICDFMVEYNKHFNQQVNVSSTEKIHKDMYKDIKMEEMPFPGCEFFEMYSEADRKPEGLVFDWSHSDVTRNLELTEDPRRIFPDVDIENYKEWDLVKLTGNYLKIILSYLATGTGSVVVHCISGWDRTPLFVSLLRLSLWADGVIHESLDPIEIAYLTVAYDWFLFGHNFPDRLSKGQEVMHFCFNFLQYITSDEFSVTRMFKELKLEKKDNRKFPEYVPKRRVALSSVRAYVLELYNEAIRPEIDSNMF